MEREQVEAERPAFEAAVRSSDSNGALALDFSRHDVQKGYAGYINLNAESAFFGWLLAKRTAAK